MLFLNPILFLLLAIRLYRIGLHKHLPVFLGYALINGTLSVATLVLWTPRQRGYVLVWMILQIVFLSLQALCAWEAFERRTERIYDLGWVGRLVLAGSAASGASVAALTLFSPSTSTWMDLGVEALQLSARLIRVFLLVTLIASLTFFRLFPIDSIRNLAMHTRILCCYIATQAAAAWLAVIVGRASHAAVNTALLGAGSLCILAWMLLLRPEPQPQPPSGPPPDLEEEAAAFEAQVRNAARRIKP